MTRDDMLLAFWRAAQRLRNQDRGFTITRADAIEDLRYLASGEHGWPLLFGRAATAAGDLLGDRRPMPHQFDGIA